MDGIIIVPAFGDAGRITVRTVHYARSVQDGFIPVGESEYSRDNTFGYTSSSIPDWVEEKTGGEVPAGNVARITLDTLRSSTEEAVKILEGTHNRQCVSVDIVTEEDLRLLSLALIRAESAGKRFIYRVGPPFVRARIGQDITPPLDEARISQARRADGLAPHGLIMVGSHVDITTRQLNYLRSHADLVELEIEAAKVIDDATREAHIEDLVTTAVHSLGEKNVVIATSRTVIKGKDGEESLSISRKISSAVVEIVQKILERRPPKFVIAKGGITSSDVATKGLSIRHATVIEPMLPGIVSLWSGQDGPAQGIPYIVFAGNVGDETSLAEVAEKLTRA